MHNGNVHRWRVLVKHMDADQPVYAIQPKGLDDRQQPHTTIEEMAAIYIVQLNDKKGNSSQRKVIKIE